MLCVSIAQESQRLAVFDMFNASQSCDLIELRLDRFEKTPDIKELLTTRFKPVIISCRRFADGGYWQQNEEARLALLRQAVLEKADFVELEVDVADQVRRYGETKRIVTYTNTREVPDDLSDIYSECVRKDADVVKITVPTRTPEEAWPLIKLLAKAPTPVVAVGWGRAGRLLNVLGQRYKSPWTYAALEKGMEAYPGMSSIRELDDYYDLRNIGPKTPLLGVTGAPPEQDVLARLFNVGFHLAGDKTRCLPLDLEDVNTFAKVVGAIRLAGVAVDPEHAASILAVTHEQEEAVQQCGACDAVAIKNDKWYAFSAQPRAVRKLVEQRLAEHRPDEPTVKGKTFVVVGTTPQAKAVATAFSKHGAAVVVADRDNDRAKRVAAEMGARYMPSGQVYSTLVDGLILCRGEKSPRGEAAIPIPNSVAREGLIGVDLTDPPFLTPFLDELRVMRGLPVAPVDVMTNRVQMIVKALTGTAVPLEGLRDSLAAMSLNLDEVPAAATDG